MSSKTIEINEQFELALKLVTQTSSSVFITGRAGTGKSTFLEYLRTVIKKRSVVLAPTGVAALNVRGQTIHSFFGFKPDITIAKARERARMIDASSERSKLYRTVEAIIIDEVSMVRADLLDAVDAFLRIARKVNMPFGGAQMIFIGDLYQLPPVVTSQEREAFASHYGTPYFFSASVFGAFAMKFIEFEKIYRQKDQSFIRLLNAIRNNTVTDGDLAILNRRVLLDFEPTSRDFYISLTPTNEASRVVNERRLAGLSGKMFRYHGSIEGNFDVAQLPTDEELHLKRGAQVMMVTNDPARRWVNGTIGRIESIKRKRGEPDVLNVLFSSGDIYEVAPHNWEIFSYTYDALRKQIDSETIGSFTQYPLKLAWSVTIHKSQGKTFDKVIIDMGRGAFAHGQTYVALSRATSLEGLILKKPIKKQHVLVDWKIIDFLTRYQYQLSNEQMPLENKIQMIEDAIKHNRLLEIVYLKKQDEKSVRVIEPRFVGEMDYEGKQYLGVEAFCHTRQDLRTFRVDRILLMREYVKNKNINYALSNSRE